MLIENVELTMSHLGLGNLTEYALMVLFGNAHSHHLTLGVENTPDQILDHQGHVLYPAYFMTHLQVPPHVLLPSFRLWEHVQVGVDVKRFGETLLESAYILGRGDGLPEDAEQWDLENHPSVKANNLIVVDVTEGGAARKVSVPKPGCFASLPKIKRPPQAITRAKQVRSNGFDMPGFEAKITTDRPISYFVEPHRDAAPGHAMIFAKFFEVMDHAETKLLSERLQPGFQNVALNGLNVLERETYFYGNCFAGEFLDIFIRADARVCDSDFHGDSLHMISAAVFEFQIEVYQHRNNQLLAMARVKKLLALPTFAQDSLQDVKRLLTLHF